MERAVTVACVQAEPVILDRERTLDRLEELAAEASRNGAELVVFPETLSDLPIYSREPPKANLFHDGTADQFALQRTSVCASTSASLRFTPRHSDTNTARYRSEPRPPR